MKKKQKLPLSEKCQNPNEKRRNRDKIDTPNIHINDRSLSWLRIGTAIKSDGAKLSSMR